MPQSRVVRFEGLFQVSIVAHHLISYTREALQGKAQPSNYSLQQVEHEEQAPAPRPESLSD